MPGLQELLGILIVCCIGWVLREIARVAIRLILYMIVLALFVGAFYFVFVR